jgi:GntR family transcriptional repressor for pyruvate dehydrogenase complex
MFEVKPVKKITVTEQVMEQIAHLITSGDLKPGEKLPNERDLAEQFDVTRGRIREALRALSLVGLITIKAGEGSFINTTQTPILSDTIAWMYHRESANMDDVYDARKLIESEVLLSAVKHVSEHDLNNIDRIIQSMLKVPVGDVKNFQNLLDEFDLYMGELSENRIYTKLMQTIVYLRRETSLKILNVQDAWENSIKHRINFVTALKEGDMRNIESAIAQIYKSAKKLYRFPI